MKIKSLFVGDTDNTFIQFFRYCFVGGFAFVVDFGVMTLLTEVFSVYPVVSSTVSFVAGLLVNYLLSTFWIFKNSKIKNRFAEFLAFALIGVIGLGINAAIIWLFQNPLATGLVFGGESAVVFLALGYSVLPHRQDSFYCSCIFMELLRQKIYFI